MTRVTCPRMHGADWKMPKRKAFTPEGVTLGAWVTFEGGAYGQVWSAAPNSMWWVVTENGAAYLRATNELTAISQCVQDALPTENTEMERTTYMTTTTSTRTRKATASKAAPKRTTRKTAASHGKTSPVPATATPRWEDRKAARRALAAELRAAGVKVTPETWAQAKAERGIK